MIAKAILDEMTTTVSVSHKVNLGNYESAEVFVSVSGITASDTPTDIEEMLAQSKIAYDFIKDKIREKAANLRQEFSHG